MIYSRTQMDEQLTDALTMIKVSYNLFTDADVIKFNFTPDDRAFYNAANDGLKFVIEKLLHIHNTIDFSEKVDLRNDLNAAVQTLLPVRSIYDDLTPDTDGTVTIKSNNKILINKALQILQRLRIMC